MHWFFKFLIISCTLIILWFVVFFIPPKILPQEVVSNAEVHGLLIRNQVWSGTMRVTGDLITGPNTTITLKPGTKILIAVDGDKSNFDLLPWHFKNGINTGENYRGVERGEPFWNEGQKIQLHFNKLIALGTKEQQIIITSDSSPGSPYDFNILSVNSGVLSYVKLSNYRRFEVGGNVVIRDSELNNTGECSICINSGKPSVIHNIFSNNLREYIWIYRSDPKISDNEFRVSRGVGIRMNPARVGTPFISHNNFEMHQSKSIEVFGGAEFSGGVVSYNKFAGGTIIQIPCDSKLKFLQNSILGGVSFSTGSCVGTYIFGANYWGTQDAKTVLSDQIILKEKQFQVILTAILRDPPEDVGRRE